MEGIGRVESGTETESETGVRTEDAYMEVGGGQCLEHIVEQLSAKTNCFLMLQLKFKIQFLALICIILILPISVSAEPIADWASSTKFSQKYKEALEQFKERRCIPDSSEVISPLYPKSEVFAVLNGSEKPECLPNKKWKSYGSIILLSYDDPSKIGDWYRKHLTGFSEFSFERGIIFIKGDFTEFEWNRDFPKSTNILIMPAREAYMKAGYQTTIEFNNVAP